MATGVKDFLKKNIGGVAGGAIFGATALAEISAGEGKLKTLLKTMKDIALVRVAISTGLAGAFGLLSKAIRGAVKDSGSLHAAMEKLSKLQGATRAIANLVGGMDLAKKKVAELMAVANGRGKLFGFESWAEAFKTIQTASRGAKSGLQDLIRYGDAAASTGNSLQATTDVVAEFYDTLRNGQSIAATADQLRKMGVASQAEADNLNALQAAGADAAQMFDELNKVLDKHSGAMRDAGNDATAVAARYQKAGDQIKEAIGEAFTADEVENTKNMADAYEAIIPTVSRLAGFMAKLTGGFSTASSAMAKWAAQSPSLTGSVEGVIKAVSVLVATISGLAMLAVPGAITSFATFVTGLTTVAGATGLAATGLIALRVALIALAVGGGVVAVVGTFVAILGAINNFINASNEASEASNREAGAHRKVIDALQERIAAVKTLNEQMEVMNALSNELKDADKRGKDSDKKVEDLESHQSNRARRLGVAAALSTVSPLGGLLGWFGGKDKARELETARTEQSEARRDKSKLTRGVRAVAAIDQSTLAPSESELARRSMERQISRDAESAAIRARSVNPYERQKSLEEQIGYTRKRASEARAGVDARGAADARRANFGATIAAAEAQGASPAYIASLNAERSMIGSNAPQSSSAFAESQVQQLLSDPKSDKAMLNYWQERLELAREEESKAAEYASDLQDKELELVEMKKENAKRQERTDLELGALSLRASGDLRGAQKMEDQAAYKDLYDQLVSEGRDREAAAALAQSAISDKLAIESNGVNLEASKAAAVSSLARIGGGGRVGPGAGDVTKTLMERQVAVQMKMEEHLAEIRKAKAKGPVFR